MAKEENIPEFLQELDLEKVVESAELDIKPKLSIDKGNPQKIKLKTFPQKKDFADGGKYWVCDVIHNDIEKQMFAPKSFRYQLAVLMKKLQNKEVIDDSKEILGKELVVDKVDAKIDSDEFKGNAEVYQVDIAV